MKTIYALLSLAAILEMIQLLGIKQVNADMNQTYKCSNGSQFSIYSNEPGDTRIAGYVVDLLWGGKAYKLTTSKGASMTILKGEGFEVSLWRYATVMRNGIVLATKCKWVQQY